MKPASIDVSVVERLESLRPHDIPRHLMQENPVRAATDFDPNTYFTVLTHLSMKSGYVLDYVYHYSDMGGEPHLYARPVDETPSGSLAEHWDRDGQRESRLLPFLVTDGSPDGFFQLVVFLRLAGQFYLWWHANYNDLQILTSPEDIEALISVTVDRLEEGKTTALRAIDPRPTVEVSDDRAAVTYCTFTKWGGLKRLKECFCRLPPHLLLERQLLGEVKYHCGILY